MTTLPSTTSIRLPRSSNTPMITVPGSSAGPLALPHNSAMTGGDVWRIIRSNLWLIILGAVLGGAVGLGTYFCMAKWWPKYRSVGQVTVDRPFRPNAYNRVRDSDAANVDFNLPIEQRTQAAKLLSPSLWNDLIENNKKIRESSWFNSFLNKASRDSSVTPTRLAREDLEDNLRVVPIPDTHLVQVSMDAANPDDALEIVKQLVDAHIDTQQKLSSDRMGSELRAANDARSYFGRLAASSRQRMSALQGAAVTSAATGYGRMSIKEMEISQVIGSQTKAKMEAEEADQALKVIMDQIDNKGTDPYQVDMYTRQDPMVMRLQQTVDDLEVQIQAMQTTSGSKARVTADLMARREVAASKLDQATANARAMYRNQIIESAKSQLAQKQAEAATMDANVERLRSELGEITGKMADYATNKDEYDAYKEQEREAADRVAMLTNAAQQNVASIAWSSLPTKPDTLASPNLKVILPLSILIGLGLSLGIAFLREVADTRVRSPRDISRVGPMNLLGMVSDETNDPQLAGVPLHLAISQAPHSMIAEQMRQVRTRLQHAASLDTMRTIAITSPGPGDGKSMIASNLAAGLALNGRRILLVDANFRKPDLHRLFGVNNDAGFSGVLESVATLDAVTHKTQIPNLELLAAGPRPNNPTELFESPLFNDFIDRALEDYDHVIFDIGPLLVVSEAVAIAPRVDGVITVVRAKKNTRGMLSRVRETLKQIKAENLGIVLNGVQNWGGGYYGRNIKTYYAYQNAE